MGKARTAASAPKPAAPPKPRKPRTPSGAGKWVQVNLRLAKAEYNLVKTQAALLDMTVPAFAKHLVDEYMRGKSNNNLEEDDNG